MDDKKKVDQAIEKLDQALKAVAQGRVFRVGTKVLFNGKYGVITNVHEGAEDPLASTVDMRLEDGTVVERTSVSAKGLQFFRH